MQKNAEITGSPKKLIPFNWFRENKKTAGRIFKYWLFSRFILTLAAWFTNYYQKNSVYQRYIDQGFQFTSIWPLDIWCRWDSSWYLSIVGNGYVPSAELSESYSNLAFFPLYPYLVKALTVWLPGFLQQQPVLILVGLLLSNLCFIFALFGIYELAQRYWSCDTAEKTVLLMLCLPGAYIFSAFYTESLFLFLIVFAFLAAEKEQWLWAALLSMLASLTRTNGILILVPMLWLYMSKRHWKLAEMKPDILWFSLPPLGVVLHFFHLYRLTGNFFASFEAQKAWGRTVGSSSLMEFFSPLLETNNQVAVIDLCIISFFLIVAIIMLIKFPQKAYGIYAVLSVLVVFNSGRLFSMTRYVVVTFPVVLSLAASLKKRKYFISLCILFGVLQILLYTGWVNYYWIA